MTEPKKRQTHVSVPALAAALGVDPSTVHRAIAARDARYLRGMVTTPGGYHRWAPVDAAAICRAHQVTPPDGWPKAAGKGKRR